MHKKPSVPSVHHIHWFKPLPWHLSHARLHWAPLLLHSQCACLQNLAVLHWEGQQSTAQCLWKQTSLHHKGIPKQEWSGAPSHALVLPVLFCRTKHRKAVRFHQSNLIFKARVITLVHSWLYPLIIIKGNQISTDMIWLLGAECLQESRYNKYFMLDCKNKYFL